MDPKTWAVICEQFVRVKEASVAARAELLASLPLLIREEVESLLSADHDAGAFLQHPEARKIAKGDSIGTYRVLREIGSGGMGVVYLAERNDGEFRREVAIKITGGHLFGPEAERRFIYERQILAQLDHPNIVRLLDGGVFQGRRYLVMELVDGVSITESVQSASRADRLRLFADVCAAVHYAHQRLIIHGDLKPANVLVTSDGTVKLLDFGVAHCLRDNATSPDPLRPLSVAAASPEQVRGDAITLATDIYSLGVLLYELLTGRNPQYDPGVPHSEILRRILETEPHPPGHYDSSIPSDLDAIALHAMAKNPVNRYASAAELQADVERFLAGHPVYAVPRHTRYLVSKFIARNKALSLTVAALTLVLLSGAAYFYRQSRIEASRVGHARQIVRLLVADVQPRLDGMAGAVPLRRTLINGTIRFLEGLDRDTAEDTAVLRDLSRSYLQLGRVMGNARNQNLGQSSAAMENTRKAEEILERAMRKAPGDPSLLREAAVLHSERTELHILQLQLPEADAQSEIALQYARRYAAATPEGWESRRILAHATYHRGSVLARLNREDSVRTFTTALQLFRQLHGEKPEEQLMLAYAMLTEWRLAEIAMGNEDAHAALPHAVNGLKDAEQLLAGDTQFPRYRLYVSSALLLIADAYVQTGNPQAALQPALRGQTIREQLLAQDPASIQSRERMADALRTLSAVKIGLRDYPGARDAAARSVELYADLRQHGSLASMFQSGFAFAQLSFAQSARALGQQTKSCDAAAQAVALFGAGGASNRATTGATREAEILAAQCHQ